MKLKNFSNFPTSINKTSKSVDLWELINVVREVAKVLRIYVFLIWVHLNCPACRAGNDSCFLYSTVFLFYLYVLNIEERLFISLTCVVASPFFNRLKRFELRGSSIRLGTSAFRYNHAKDI